MKELSESIFAWVGFPQNAFSYYRELQKGGKTEWNYWKLRNCTLKGFTSFSVGSLKVAT